MADQNMAVNLLVDPESGEILHVSSGTTDIYGYPMEQVKTMKISDISQLSAREIGEKIGHSEYLQIIPLEIRLASGEILDARAYASLITANRSESLFLCIFNQEPEAPCPPFPDPGFLPGLSSLPRP